MPLKHVIILVAQLFLSVQLYSQILTSSNLPIIVINTGDVDIPDEPKIDGSIGIIYNGENNVNNLNGPFNYYDGAIGIETRGNSTQGFDKKTYSLELRDADNQDVSANLFGMGAEEDWILHAMVIDKSQLRIPLSFYLAQRMGNYASEWRYVELVVNNEYRGLYILTEKIKRDDDRVDIDKLASNDLTGDEVTGGYILRIDWLEEGGFESNYDSQGGIPMTFQWYYPKAGNIESEQVDYIQNWMADFEEALYADDYTNEQGVRYNDYINLNSFVDFLIINELSKNSDGYKLSSYVHKDKDSIDGRLTAGPIWDFDQTYGVSRVCSNDLYTGWTYLQNQDDCGDLESMPLWWQTMMQDTLFQNRLDCRWSTFREEFLHTDSIHSWIDNHTALLSAAIDRNFTQWDDHIGESIWIEPEPIPQSYAAEISYLKSWISNRVNWIDDNLPGNCDNDVVNATEEVASKQTIEVYPNPNHSFLTIEMAISSPLPFSLYSNTGSKIMDGVIYSNKQQIDLTGVPPGVLFLRIGQQNIKVLRME